MINTNKIFFIFSLLLISASLVAQFDVQIDTWRTETGSNTCLGTVTISNLGASSGPFSAGL